MHAGNPIETLKQPKTLKNDGKLNRHVSPVIFPIAGDVFARFRILKKLVIAV